MRTCPTSLFLCLGIFSALFAPNAALAEAPKAEKGSIYSPIGKRDPFRQPVAEAGRDVSSVNPLEKWGLEKLQLKAILKGIGRPRAMFEDPDGRSFILSEGDIVGRERGTISRILNKEVIITERTFNYLGAQSLYERILSLPNEDAINEVDGSGNNSGNKRRPGEQSDYVAPAGRASAAAPAGGRSVGAPAAPAAQPKTLGPAGLNVNSSNIQ